MPLLTLNFYDSSFWSDKRTWDRQTDGKTDRHRQTIVVFPEVRDICLVPTVRNSSGDDIPERDIGSYTPLAFKLKPPTEGSPMGRSPQNFARRSKSG